LLGEWERLKSDLSKDEGEISGYYSLGCHVSVGMYTLHHFLPSLLRDNPRLQINLTHDLSRKITEAVIDFKLDVGLVVNPIRHPDLVIKPLFEDAVCLWTSTKRFNSDVLIYDPELMQSQHIIGLMAKEKLIFDRTITSGSLEIIRSLISSGAGVGILPSRVARLAEPKSLTPFREKNFKFFDKISLIYRSDLQKSAGSRLLITAMAKILEQV
jgi:DNA-binding transcriptional LysR family regulator